jgi:hypothetical protein
MSEKCQLRQERHWSNAKPMCRGALGVYKLELRHLEIRRLSKRHASRAVDQRIAVILYVAFGMVLRWVEELRPVVLSLVFTKPRG